MTTPLRRRPPSGGAGRSLIAAGVVFWLIFIAYCWHDRNAAILAAVLPPIFGIAFLIALRSRSIVLSIFFAFTFISHAIAPPFFFLRKQSYSYGGDFGAVKNFGFQPGELLHIYLLVFVFSFAVLFFAILGIRAFRRPAASVSQARDSLLGLKRRTLFDVLIILFVIAVAIPQSLWMYRMRVGITGLIAPILPFRLTGITYYSRLFLYPVLLFGAYTVAKRKLPTSIALLLYAWIGGLCGSSRYLVMVTAAPVILFALIDRQRIRFVAASAVGLVAFTTVTMSRTYVYSGEMPFRDYAAISIRGGIENMTELSIDDLVGGIALRLYGPQDVVLAYQYDVDSRARAMVRWFTGGVVVEDLNYAFYGMTFNAGSGFGVGLGVCPWMIVLSRRSYPVLIFLAMVIAALLVLADRGVEAIKRSRTFIGSIMADPLAFFIVFTLYGSTIRWCYDLIVLSFLAAGFLHVFASTPRLVHKQGVA